MKKIGEKTKTEMSFTAYISAFKELWLISFSVVNMTEKSQSNHVVSLIRGVLLALVFIKRKQIAISNKWQYDQINSEIVLHTENLMILVKINR